MKTRGENKVLIIYIISLILLGLVLIMSVAVSLGYYEIFGESSVKNGKIDIARTDFPVCGESFLDGTWEFYWGKLLGTYNIKNIKPDGYIKVPGRWMTQDFSNGGHSEGTASYRLVIDNMRIGESLSCYIPGMLGDYRIFINGNLVAENDKNNAAKVSSTVAGDSSVEVIIEVDSNILGGMYRPPLLARSGSLSQTLTMRNNIAILFLGILFITLLEFFIVFVVSNKNKVDRYIIMFGVAVFMRYFSSTSMVLMFNLRSLSFFHREGWAIFYFVLMVLSVLLGIYLLDALFPGCVDKRYKKALTMLAVAAAVVAVFSWGYFYYRYLKFPAAIIIIYMFLYMMKASINAVKTNSVDSLVCTVGIWLTMLGIQVDNLYINGIIIYDVSFVMPACLIGTVFAFSFTLSRRERTNYEDLLQTQKFKTEIANTQAAFLASQIHPHFLYNTLTSIQELCYTAPDHAADAIVKFSSYLRTNIDFLKQEKLIPFSKELSHIENYMAIERMRFGDKINFRTDIDTAEFYIPPLSVQPLVDNAVKHGLRKILREGTVTLSVKRQEEGIYIIVEDNGGGFDVEELEKRKSTGGVNNVRLRLKNELNAALSYESRINEGTKATIYIPKREDGK
jgi:sensor histidine kinase YesM